ncbi:MAG: DUF7674 family protein [Flavipsychrobacter sp.]
MITQTDLTDNIQADIPELSGTLCEKDKTKNVYQVMYTLLDYTHAKIVEHNFNTVKKCLQLAEKLYEKGNGMVRNAVVNVFIYSFSKFLLHDEEDRKVLVGLIPVTLYTLYVKQMLHSNL